MVYLGQLQPKSTMIGHGTSDACHACFRSHVRILLFVVSDGADRGQSAGNAESSEAALSDSKQADLLGIPSACLSMALCCSAMH